MFTLESASKYINDKLGVLARQRGIITTNLNNATKLKARAERAGDATGTVKATELVGKLMHDLETQGTIERELDHYFPSWRAKANALGVVPLVAAAIAIPVAILLYNHLSAVRNQAKALELVEKGILTAEQAKGLTTQDSLFGNVFGASPQTLALIAAGGLALYLTWPMLLAKRSQA